MMSSFCVNEFKYVFMDVYNDSQCETKLDIGGRKGGNSKICYVTQGEQNETLRFVT